MDVYTLAFIALAALVTWRLHRRYPGVEGARSKWIYVPLASAAVLWVVTVLTFGAGVLLAPVGVCLTWAASRRTPARSLSFWIGTVLNGCLAFGFVLTIGILVHGIATGQA